MILETVPSLEARYGLAFAIFEDLSVAIFSVEYVLRLWSCTSTTKYRHPIFGRLRFALTPLALIDLIAIGPAYMPGDVFVDLRYARVVRLVRLLRILKMARYSKTLRTFSSVASAPTGCITKGRIQVFACWPILASFQDPKRIEIELSMMLA